MPCDVYTDDLTSGQTFSESAYDYTDGKAEKMFDDNSSTGWSIGDSEEADAVEWFQVLFGTAQPIIRLTMYVPLANYAPSGIAVKSSNTGAFGGEETTLYTSGALTWTNGETKTFDWENSTSYIYYRVYCTTGIFSAIFINECQMMACQPETGDTEGENADDVGISDSSDAFSLTDTISETIGALDSVDGSKETETPDINETISIGDVSDGFNWSAWSSANRDRAVVRYYCTLTGASDGLSDLTIPISSFQATKRTGESTYLSVVVPGITYAEQIADRSNGEIVIYMAYLLDGVESLREEILRAELEQINPQYGARGRSITLIGHKTVTYDARAVSIQGCNYKYTSGGSRGFRFPQADPYLNPGDALTVIDTEDVLTVDYITYAISARGAKFMEVREG
jgi:hypothetical protein